MGTSSLQDHNGFGRGFLTSLDRLAKAQAATSAGEGAQHVAAWLLDGLGPSVISVRLFLASRAGQLRTAGVSGGAPSEGRMRSARRREVFRTGIPCRVPLTRSTGSLLAIMPLRSARQPFGVVEVVFATAPDDPQWAVSTGLVEHAGVIVAGLRERDSLRGQLATLKASAELAAAMLEARTIPGCVRAAARFCHERFEAPVAFWWAGGTPGRLNFLGAYGFGTRRRARLRQSMDLIPGPASLPQPERDRYLARFRDVAGAPEVSVVDAGSAVLLVATDDPALEDELSAVRSLLIQACRNVDRVLAADQREARVDLGLAWTAHEVRGPLHGVAGVIDLLLATTGPEQPLRELLDRSRRELNDLAGQVETLLRWAVGPTTLRRRRTNLMDVIARAIESCSLETGEQRVKLVGPQQLVVAVDAAHLRSALTNLIRNALAYSSPHGAVQVRVRESGERVIVSVLDQGRYMVSDERDRLFDPFVRGRSSRGRTAGAGLGLFIARRIVEAHGGSLWVEPGAQGTAFHLALPRTAGQGGASRPSVSRARDSAKSLDRPPVP